MNAGPLSTHWGAEKSVKSNDFLFRNICHSTVPAGALLTSLSLVVGRVSGRKKDFRRLLQLSDGGQLTVMNWLGGSAQARAWEGSAKWGSGAGRTVDLLTHRRDRQETGNQSGGKDQENPSRSWVNFKIWVRFLAFIQNNIWHLLKVLLLFLLSGFLCGLNQQSCEGSNLLAFIFQMRKLRQWGNLSKITQFGSNKSQGLTHGILPPEPMISTASQGCCSGRKEGGLE